MQKQPGYTLERIEAALRGEFDADQLSDDEQRIFMDMFAAMLMERDSESEALAAQMRDEGGYVGLDEHDNLVRTLPGGGVEVIEISDAERQRRQEYVDYARATVELEGFTVDDATKDRARRYITGEITLAELVALKPK
jgi:hypothetical protein